MLLQGALYLAAGAAGINDEGGHDMDKSPGGGGSGAGITTTNTATGPFTAQQMTPGATATDAGALSSLVLCFGF